MGPYEVRQAIEDVDGTWKARIEGERGYIGKIVMSGE